MFLERRPYIARVEHWCDRCCQHIMPGEEYERIVELMEHRGNRVVVWRIHSNPSCDEPEDPEWEEADADLEESEAESLPEAA